MKKRYGGGKLWFFLLSGAAVARGVWLLGARDTGGARADREESLRKSVTVAVGPGSNIGTASERASDLNRTSRVPSNDSNGLPTDSTADAKIVESASNAFVVGATEEQVADRPEAGGSDPRGPAHSRTDSYPNTG